MKVYIVESAQYDEVYNILKVFKNEKSAQNFIKECKYFFNYVSKKAEEYREKTRQSICPAKLLTLEELKKIRSLDPQIPDLLYKDLNDYEYVISEHIVDECE
jgi:hypothetical protein